MARDKSRTGNFEFLIAQAGGRPRSPPSAVIAPAAAHGHGHDHDSTAGPPPAAADSTAVDLQRISASERGWTSSL